MTANSKTLKYNNLLETIYKVWRLRHANKLNDDKDDKESVLANTELKGKVTAVDK